MVERVIGETVAMIQRIFGKQFWGPSLHRTFTGCLRLLYQEGENPTFEDILDLLKGKRRDNGGSRDVEEFQEELEALPRVRADAVINKVEPFVKNTMLRQLFCTKKSSIDLSDLMGRVVIFRLAKGELSEINLQTIGSAILTKLWFHCVARQRAQRKPLFLVVDEFHNFGYLETLESLLAESRKYSVCLALAHQHTQQIPEKLLAAVLGNTGTRIIFRVSNRDAKTLAGNLATSGTSWHKLVKVIGSLPDGVAVCSRRGGFGQGSRPAFKMKTYPPLPRRQVDLASLLIRMRERYADDPGRLRVEPKIIKILEIVSELGEMGQEATASRTLSLARSRGLASSGSEVSSILDQAQTLGLVERETIPSGKGGRPKIITSLTDKGRKHLGIGITTGTSTKAGGELHRHIIIKLASKLRRDGWVVEIPVQGGSKPQPDLLGRKPSEDESLPCRDVAFEVETSAKHPGQVEKNYTKNTELGREVVFVVPDRTTARGVERILSSKGIRAQVAVFV